MKRLATALAFFAALLVIWELGSRFLWNARAAPPPSKVAIWLWKYTASGDLLNAALVTMRRLGIGYLIGLGLGIPLGLLSARFTVVRDTVGVVALGFQTLPSVCWAPLAILALGVSEASMLFIAVMGTLWAVLLAAEHGVRQIPPLYGRAAATMGSKGFHLLWHVLLPASLPHLVSGAKQGWAFAWRSLMAAEVYIYVSNRGLGQVLHWGRELGAMEQVIGIMIVIILVGILADKVLFGPWERFLRKRWGLA